jgi:hypothetical protein
LRSHPAGRDGCQCVPFWPSIRGQPGPPGRSAPGRHPAMIPVYVGLCVAARAASIFRMCLPGRRLLPGGEERPRPARPGPAQAARVCLPEVPLLRRSPAGSPPRTGTALVFGAIEYARPRLRARTRLRAVRQPARPMGGPEHDRFRARGQAAVHPGSPGHGQHHQHLPSRERQTLPTHVQTNAAANRRAPGRDLSQRSHKLAGRQRTQAADGSCGPVRLAIDHPSTSSPLMAGMYSGLVTLRDIPALLGDDAYRHRRHPRPGAGRLLGISAMRCCRGIGALSERAHSRLKTAGGDPRVQEAGAAVWRDPAHLEKRRGVTRRGG